MEVKLLSCAHEGRKSCTEKFYMLLRSFSCKLQYHVGFTHTSRKKTGRSRLWEHNLSCHLNHRIRLDFSNKRTANMIVYIGNLSEIFGN